MLEIPRTQSSEQLDPMVTHAPSLSMHESGMGSSRREYLAMRKNLEGLDIRDNTSVDLDGNMQTSDGRRTSAKNMGKRRAIEKEDSYGKIFSVFVSHTANYISIGIS